MTDVNVKYLCFEGDHTGEKSQSACDWQSDASSLRVSGFRDLLPRTVPDKLEQQ